MHDYVRRHVDGMLDDLLGAFPAVMITGPRGCGKSTTAGAHAASVISLDDELQAAAFASGPDAFLAVARRPVLIDEWQLVPSSLSAVKRAVDRDYSPGQFLITGSVRSRLMAAGWPGTGRVIPVRQWGMTQAELSGRAEVDLAWLRAPESLRPAIVPGAPTVVDYIDAALAGGFPEAILLAPRRRETWYDGYVEQLIHKDVEPLASLRTPAALQRLLAAVAANSAGQPSLASLAEAANVDQRTATAYVDILEDLRIIQRVPPWFHNRLTRMVKAPKYYVTDAGLAANLARADKAGVMRDGVLLGRLLDTFVAAQLRPLLDLAQPRIELFYLRDSQGRHEVDLVLEIPGQGIIGVEVKASAAVSGHDARHLAWLRDQVPDEFVAGYVLHTGSAAFPLGDRVWALPLAALWRPEIACGG